MGFTFFAIRNDHRRAVARRAKYQQGGGESGSRACSWDGSEIYEGERGGESWTSQQAGELYVRVEAEDQLRQNEGGPADSRRCRAGGAWVRQRASRGRAFVGVWRR